MAKNINNNKASGRDSYEAYKENRKRKRSMLVRVGAIAIAGMFLIWTVIGSLMGVAGF